MSMKKNVKLAVLLAAVIMMFTLLAFVVSADETGGEIDTTGAVYVVYNADGELVGAGKTAKDFANAVSYAEDGSTVKLLKTIDMTSYAAAVTLQSSIASPREVSLDLAGNGVFSHIKTVMFSAIDYSTLNVYSSLPGGYVFNNSSSNNDYGHSGANFTTGGKSATINLGRYECADGTVYSGYNFSSYSSCIVDLSSSSNNPQRNKINLIEGNYFSVLSDYTGALITRSNDTDIYAKNANILLDHGSYPINSAVAAVDSTITIEDSILIGSADEAKPMFNNLGGFVTFNNVISNYPLAVQTTSSDARHPESVLLLGNCIFSSRDDITEGIISTEIENPAMGRVAAPEYTLVNGGTSIPYYPNIEVNGPKNPMVTVLYNLPVLDKASVLTSADELVKVRWSADGKNVTVEEFWCAGVKPQGPATVELPESFGDGSWEYGWVKTIDQDGVPFYKIGKRLKLTIYASAESDGDGVVFNILVPADLIDNGDLIFTDSSINGGVYLKREWEPITVYGNDYYYASTPTMYDEEIYDPVSVVLTCYKEIDGESEIVSASYEFDLEYYVNYIINAEEGTYEADAIEYAEELYDMFFADDVVDDDPVILPDDEDGEEDLEDGEGEGEE